MAKKRAAKTAKKASAKKSTTKTTKKRAAKRTKKSAPKKTAAAKKNAAKAAASAMKDIIARARDHYRRAPADRVFVVTDGKTLADLRDLTEALEDMAQHVFDHHVNDMRHDFANWVEEVLHEQALAEELRGTERNPHQHQRAIYRHIVRRVW